MKKFLISMVLGFTTVTSFAQSSNIFAERADLIRRLGTSQSYSMGWYTGALSNNDNDIREINENFLGLSNYLSIRLNNLIVLETIKSDRVVGEEGLKGNFDLLYTSSLIGSQLIEKGWKPIVERTESITPIVLALKSNKRLNSEKDFSKSKIIGSNGITYTMLSYTLTNNKVADVNVLNKNGNIISKKISQENLVNVLNNQQADGIVIRSFLAEKLLAESDKYKIVYKGQSVPGHMIVLNPKVDSVREEQIRSVFLSLNSLDKKSVVLKAIDGHNPKLELFKSVSQEGINLSSAVFKKTKQIPLNNVK